MDRRVAAQTRHLQVIELEGLGLTSKQIAEQLGVSVFTVHWHRNRERAISRRRAEAEAGIDQ